MLQSSNSRKRVEPDDEGAATTWRHCSRCLAAAADERVVPERVLPVVRKFDGRQYCSWDCVYGDFCDAFGANSIASRALRESLVGSSGRTVRWAETARPVSSATNQCQSAPLAAPQAMRTDRDGCRFLERWSPACVDPTVIDD